MIIVKAVAEDLVDILDLQKLAYQSEAKIYDDFSIPPLIQTLEDLEQEFSAKIILKAVLDDEQLTGSVRAWQEGTTCHIERLIVHPDFQGRGIGTKLMHKIENIFSAAKRFELFTGHKSEKNLHLYKKLGYKIFKQQLISDRLSLIYLEKKV